MTRAEANRFLDRVKAGEIDPSAASIGIALRATGDIGCGSWPRPKRAWADVEIVDHIVRNDQHLEPA